MQTWAKRGVQAALVTGGMLAVGSGVASAGESPQRPMPQGAPAPGQAGTAPNGDQLTGELFPADAQYNRPVIDERSEPALAGRLDVERDLMPSVENEMTRELPALRFLDSPLQLAGWVADPGAAKPLDLGRSAHGQPPVTPSEGFQRSLSWAGPIGEVVQREETAADLVIPHDDLVYFDGFGQADGIVDLWDPLVKQDEAPLIGQEESDVLAFDSVDLTDAELPGFRDRLHAVPPLVLANALSIIPVEPTPRAEFVPLHVPGEDQAKATEVPPLDGLTAPELAKIVGTSVRGGPGVSAPLPGLGQLNALDGGHTSVPAPSRINAALDEQPGTGGSPLLGQMPDVRDATTPMPALTPEMIRSFEEAETVVMARI
ncbi:hypothetical protein GCM10009854_08170 [Saccharopolyspora halophila]|uniref:Uncharacterized protein n=1 Tax=Saccharopolyspora halophila TaxID=405551 RepID=A0ABP5SMJ8_9PSEU